MSSSAGAVLAMAGFGLLIFLACVVVCAGLLALFSIILPTAPVREIGGGVDADADPDTAAEATRD